MKLMTFEEFCNMPEGTIFQEYNPHFLGELKILSDVRRGDSGKAIDFTEAGLLPQTYIGSYWRAGERPKLKDGTDVTEGGLYIVSPDDFGRWGTYDYKTKFLVWELEDRERLSYWLLNPKRAIKDADDDEIFVLIDGEK